MIIHKVEEQLFLLSTDKMTMALRYGEDILKNIYWGATIQAEDVPSDATYFHSTFDADIWQERQEYPVYNGQLFTQPALLAGRDGNNALHFKVHEHHVEGNVLCITLRDLQKKLTMCLEYHVYEEFDIIGRRATLKNDGDAITIQRFFSSCFTLPAFRGKRLRYLTGKWAGECQIQDVVLAPGNIELQSRRGISCPHFNPSFCIHDDAAEETGDVWFGLLAYSGNWIICVEKTSFDNVHILGGRNDFDSAETLACGETLTTPMFYGGFSAQGFGGMSRLLHAFELSTVMRAPSARPVLYNSWEATAFSVNVNSQKELAQHAAEIGVELFVVDDGWFGQRNSDRVGLGDWTVNTKKFPSGLDELIDEVKHLGMQFGIWVEPEAVNPDSDLFRHHPDWIYQIADTEPMLARNQYVLNLSLPQVKAYIKKFLQKLLTEHDIRYLKWDMNRPITDVAGFDLAGNGCCRRGHVEALYEIWTWLRETFPHVALESCSGGGGRVDAGILQWADTFWPSDNTDPYDRLFIQEGFTQFYAPLTMTCWVTDAPENGGRTGRCKTAYKFHSAMCGSLGIGADISKLDAANLAEYKEHIAEYKKIRNAIQLGKLYRLSSPSSGFTAVEYIFQSQVVVLAFLHSQRFGNRMAPLRLKGLQSTHCYRMEDGSTYTGNSLMNLGLPMYLEGDFSSCLVVLSDWIDERK